MILLLIWWAEVEHVLPARPDISPVCSKYRCYAQISTINQLPQIDYSGLLIQTVRSDSWTVAGSPSKTLDRLGLLVRWTVRTSSPGIWGRTIGSPARHLLLHGISSQDSHICHHEFRFEKSPVLRLSRAFSRGRRSRFSFLDSAREGAGPRFIVELIFLFTSKAICSSTANAVKFL